MPMASASIGQVHAARLQDGRGGRRQGPARGHRRTRCARTWTCWPGLALLAERVPELAAYRPAATVAEMGRVLRRELDFGREERNLQQFCAATRTIRPCAFRSRSRSTAPPAC